MSALASKFTAALAAVQNENSVSLANINADFTLFKFEAPKEFDGLGSVISHQRKDSAERGSLHRTARKLGALFARMLPSTPALFRAYGTRVSEISEKPELNPRGTDREGIFARHLGADCGSIWAAATSGPEAIAVHLLACMLARVFTSQEAISVWVELVDKQKHKIQDEVSESMYPERLGDSVIASQQEISRLELGNWDASARAWLQIADQAKERQHTQLRLILDNANILINNEAGVYLSVMAAWKSGLVAMDSLVRGIPQQVQEGAALLAISSWHMYPNLLVLGEGTVEVQQGDDLFGCTAILTVGLQTVRESHAGVSWSLPLACLRFYGRPVSSQGTLGSDNTRISMDQFGYIVLGCVFSTWKTFGTSVEIGITWLQRLVELVRPELQKRLSHRDFNNHWLIYLDQCAQRFLDCTGVELQLATQLVALGRRHAEFVNPSISETKPLFGLSNINILIRSIPSTEERILFLRKLGSQLNMEGENYIIRYLPFEVHHSSSKIPFEFCTLRAADRKHASNKRTYEGHDKNSPARSGFHTRRLSTTRKGFQPCRCKNRRVNTTCKCSQPTYWMLECRNRACDRECSDLTHTSIWARHLSIRSLDEFCLATLEEDDEEDGDGIRLRFGQGTSFEGTMEWLKKDCFVAVSNGPLFKFKFVMGNSRMAAIFKRDDISTRNPSPIAIPLHLEDMLTPKILDIGQIVDYLLQEQPQRSEIGSLMACAAAAEVYKLMPDATISTKVLSYPLYDSKWAKLDRGLIRKLSVLNRQQAFACISMFDSGSCNLDPAALQEVFAMSSGNSLYVSGSLLCDPIEEVQANEIRRVVGNIGRSGVSLLMSTPDPEILPPELENWKQINYYPFTGVSENNFQDTTVHLSFTGYDLPLMAQQGDRHIDRPATLIETLVSVHERGKWVADLDVTKSPKLPHSKSNFFLHRVLCEGHKAAIRYNECKKRPRLSFGQVLPDCERLSEAVCIDNWDELLEAPKSGTFFVRSNKNWLARFALTSVCKQLGFKTHVLPSEVCWPCASYSLLDRTDETERIALIF